MFACVISGYMHIEGWSFADAFYMGVITLTTTGFQEVHPMSDAGRWFTSLVLISGVSFVAYAATTATSILMSMDFAARRKRKMQKHILKLKNHTVVCGYGRMGTVICRELAKANHEFVVIEKNPNLLEDLKKTNFLWVDGDAADDEVLEQAGVPNCRVLASMIDSDTDALYISIAVRSLNPSCFIIARANLESAQKKLLKAGANKVILPLVMSGKKVAESVLNPAVEDFLDITGVQGNDESRIQIFDLNVAHDNLLHGKTLNEMGPRAKNLIVVGIRRKDQSFEFAPPADYVFKDGDCLIAIGNKSSYEQVLATYKLKAMRR